MEELIQEVTDDFRKVMVKDIGTFSVWHVCMSMLAEYVWATGEPCLIIFSYALPVVDSALRHPREEITEEEEDSEKMSATMQT